MVKYSVKKFLYVVLTIYISFSLCVIYIVFLEKDSSTSPSNYTTKYENIQVRGNKQRHFHRTINIWGKAAIAEYLWMHIFEGRLSSVPGYLLYKGMVNIEKLKISYTTGPYLITSTADTSVRDLIIVLNGREKSKVDVARTWLDALVNKQHFYHLQNLGIIVLGNELCNNDWLWDYVDSFSMLIKFVFIVYDISSVTGSRPIYQWPLGVATYRDFPLITKTDVDINSVRKYKCNFLGTIYANSSRELLMQLLKDKSYNCFVKVRYMWLDKEPKESMFLYHNVLKGSDLTLCPVGINSESYRIYEALSYGSVPVLEDVMTPGKCGRNTIGSSPPYLLLKKYNAPVIYIKNWNELPKLLEREAIMTQRELIKRRRKILDWYELFRYKMREELLSVTVSSFE